MLKKFKEFVTEPNLRQILKLDCISPGLRPYLLENSGQKYQLKKRHNGLKETMEQIWYEVSFRKLMILFPNTEEIHFRNWYKLDNSALRKLIGQIKRKDNTLTAVKFLYYDYTDPLDKHLWFFDHKKLESSLLTKLEKANWTINAKKEKAGYYIKLRKIST